MKRPGMGTGGGVKKWGVLFGQYIHPSIIQVSLREIGLLRKRKQINVRHRLKRPRRLVRVFVTRRAMYVSDGVVP